MLCKYKDMFGKPNTGVHKHRLLDIAIVDVGMTVGAAYALHKVYKFNFMNTLIILFLLGILAHRAFCVRTTVDKLLFD